MDSPTFFYRRNGAIQFIEPADAFPLRSSYQPTGGTKNGTCARFCIYPISVSQAAGPKAAISSKPIGHTSRLGRGNVATLLVHPVYAPGTSGIAHRMPIPSERYVIAGERH
ncbi:hypothetical protein COLINT_02003 [Collinsella intestinalis DSM 13280]|uniref:Uncharacterized protein n=1 Tax=Collinsella intestinalis DSM 13280 TaxID=521003 RepID=C4F7I8_9ACTN|nr:hypothetical protein COLINT_02003 [Collinsella intestinalis DSM 13280]